MTIQLNLEVQEAQFILNALSEAPFKQVADLWFKIKSQAETQLSQQSAEKATTAEAPPDVDVPAPGLNDPGQA